MDERLYAAHSRNAHPLDSVEVVRWARVCDILCAALQLDGSQRSSYLEHTCAGDERLRCEVEGLLAASERSASIDQPAGAGLLRELFSNNSESSRSSPLSVGARFAHYEIVEKIGEGGMGAVFKAVDIALGRTVALKIISREIITAADKQRFAREARAASSLNHAHIITIYEYSVHNDIEFIAMEYVEGLSLGQVLKSGPVPLPDLLKYAYQVATALAKAHAAGITHRDLKPTNIMITRDGMVKVLDFGLAKQTEALPFADALSITNAGMIVGTPAYMSPEQALGQAVDSRSDIFSFGVVLYEMCVGTRPFQGQDVALTLRDLITASPKPLSEMNPLLPPAIGALVERCLCKERAQRPASMDEVVQDLSKALTAGGVKAPQVPDRGPGQWAKQRHRPTKWIAGSLLVGFLCAVASIPAVRRISFFHAIAPFGPSSGDWVRTGEPYLERYDRPGYQQKAIESFQRAIELDRENASAYMRLAEAYTTHVTGADSSHWATLALDSARAAIRLNPYLANAHASAGAAMITQGKLEEAASELQKALLLDPRNAAAHSYLGSVYERKHNLKNAEGELRKAIALTPGNWLFQGRLGDFLYRTGNPVAAIQVYQAGLRLGPDNPILNADLGAAFHASGQDEEAAVAFQRALEIRPTAQGFSNLGTLLYFVGRYRDSSQAFERALSLDASSYLRWGNLGDAYRWTPGERGRSADAYRQAIKLIREAIARAPDDTDLKSLLAVYFAKRGDKPQSLMLTDAVKQSEDPDVLSNLAQTYELCGLRAKALEKLGEAIAKGYSLKEIENEPEFNELRRDPAYQTMAARFAASH